jgi:hypothetical protein
MTISVLMMVLVFALGPAIGQSVERGSGPTQTSSHDFVPVSHCYVNGALVNPCPTNPPPPPPNEPPTPELLQ